MVTKCFLEKFVDGNTTDTQFSLIADKIHNWRNVLAHQWLASAGHKIGYDYNMELGWEDRDGVIFINPKIYSESYLKAFAVGGKIWHYDRVLIEADLEAVKRRIIEKYLKK